MRTNYAAAEERHAKELEVKDGELKESKDQLAKSNHNLVELRKIYAAAEERHAAALKAKEDAYIKSLHIEKTLSRNAIEKLQSEKSKTEKLGSDLIKMTREKVVFFFCIDDYSMDV